MLIIFMMGIALARLLCTVHQQDERLDVLENRLEQFMDDSVRRASRSAVAPRPTYDYQRPQTTHRSSHSTSPVAGATPSAAFVHATDVAADSEPSYPRKFSKPQLFDLNTIDSLTLIRIPGIAARTAHVILEQRERYGGFYNPWQLGEFLTWDAAQQRLDEWCTRWFFTDQNYLRPLSVNHATLDELRCHPYLTRQQARLITDYRARHHHIETPSEFQQLTDLSTAQMQRLLPYLSFEQ